MSCSKCDKKAYVKYKDKNYCNWYCAKKENKQMDSIVVNEIANIGLTLLMLGVGWAAVLWLDKNVFNKNRYNKFKKKDKK